MSIFCPLASGSSGNSTYIATASSGILIDAGISLRRLISCFNEVGLAFESIDAVFLTHEHSDHIMGAGAISRKLNIPVYATPGTWEEIERRNLLGDVPFCNKKYIYNGENLFFNDMCIRPFSIPHDAGEPVGFSILTGAHKMSVATDIGHITESVKENLAGSNVLLLESNHDVDMLVTGKYPEYLKKRVLGNLGHLSNVNAGILLAEITSEKTSDIFLGHLSEDNNRPMIAYETVRNILENRQIKVNLRVAERSRASSIIKLSAME